MISVVRSSFRELLLYLLVINGSAHAYADAIERVVLDTEFEVVSEASQFPVDVWDKLNSWSGAIADTGEEFNRGCVQVRGVPGARLVSGGTGDGAWYALLEVGGRGLHSVLLLVLESEGELALFAYRSFAPRELDESLAASIDPLCFVGPGHEALSEDEIAVCYGEHAK